MQFSHSIDFAKELLTCSDLHQLSKCTEPTHPMKTCQIIQIQIYMKIQIQIQIQMQIQIQQYLHIQWKVVKGHRTNPSYPRRHHNDNLSKFGQLHMNNKETENNYNDDDKSKLP